jgi:signal transduction histidine kinase
MAGECDRLNRLVERVLYFVRFGEDALVFFKRTTEVKALLDETVKLFFDSSSGHRADVDYAVEVSAGLPEIEVDDNAIQQVVLNLLDNALKYGYTDDSDVKPSINLTATIVDRRHRFMTRSRKWIRVSVTDNGPGINPAERRKIFRPYFRASSSLNANVSGVGLGLALCRHIVRSHDGWMAADNSSTGGAVFSIYLPHPS